MKLSAFDDQYLLCNFSFNGNTVFGFPIQFAKNLEK